MENITQPARQPSHPWLRYLANIVSRLAPEEQMLAGLRRETLSEIVILTPSDDEDMRMREAERHETQTHIPEYVDEGDFFVEARIGPVVGREGDLNPDVPGTAEERLVSVLISDSGEGIDFSTRVLRAEAQGMTAPGFSPDETQRDTFSEFAMAVAIRVLRERHKEFAALLPPLERG